MPLSDTPLTHEIVPVLFRALTMIVVLIQSMVVVPTETIPHWSVASLQATIQVLEQIVSMLHVMVPVPESALAPEPALALAPEPAPEPASLIKVVINVHFGGFDLTDEQKYRLEQKIGFERLRQIEGKICEFVLRKKYPDHKYRSDPDLVSVVEEDILLDEGTTKEGLAIIEIPSDIEWCIKNYDGAEWVVERTREFHFSSAASSGTEVRY